MPFDNLTSQTFGELTVIERGPTKHSHVQWFCRCSCGTRTLVRHDNLMGMRTRSCGHLRKHRKSITKREARRRPFHMTPEYFVWQAIKTGTTNKHTLAYQFYGAQGVTMCDRWRDSFEDFKADVGMKPSPDMLLSRLDKSKPYEPGNVVWSTRTETMRNRVDNHNITWNGKTLCLQAWSELLGVSAATLSQRLAKWGVSVRTFRLGPMPQSHNARTHMLTFDGKTQCLAAWSRARGIKESTVRARLSDGWSVADALTIPTTATLKRANARVTEARQTLTALNAESR